MLTKILTLAALAVTISGCGGGSSTSKAPVTAAASVLSFESNKTFRFTWTDVTDATYYQLMENPDGVSGYTQVGSDIAQGNGVANHIVPLFSRVNAQYILKSCNVTGCTSSSVVSVSGNMVDSIGYFKASNTGAGDLFGSSVSLSTDGNTLAVGAYSESSNATGIDGDQTDNSVSGSGAVYVFTRTGSTWSQQAYIKANNTGADDLFGTSVSLSEGGNTLAVGAPYEDSNAIGINGDQTDNSVSGSGAVYVFTRTGSTWSQQSYIKASNTGAEDHFGWVSLSPDGNTLAVGASGEDSNATGVNGDQADNSASSHAGAVYVFIRAGSTWSQQAYIKASNTTRYYTFGSSVSLSTDGNTLAVGDGEERSNATGIDGDQTDNSASGSGAVYVFTRTGSTWSQQAYIKASNTGVGDHFGNPVSLSADGNKLVVGSFMEGSNSNGINGDQTDNSGVYKGAAYVFTRVGSTWSQQAYIKASNANVSGVFGQAVSLSLDGNTLAVGAYNESSNATGINGDQTDNSASGAGAAYTY